jgi:GNAT superfamily N-acetyltransferase
MSESRPRDPADRRERLGPGLRDILARPLRRVTPTPIPRVSRPKRPVRCGSRDRRARPSSPSVTASSSVPPSSDRIDPSRGSHVSTASFMVRADARGSGVGRAMCEYVIARAREQGYDAMQFNAVVSTNVHAIELYTENWVSSPSGRFRERSITRRLGRVDSTSCIWASEFREHSRESTTFKVGV